MSFKIQLKNNEVHVISVLENSSAFESGLLENDHILSINGVKVNQNLDKWVSYFHRSTIELSIFRNQKLKTSDWTQGADVPDVIKTPWATYRQKLRDLPKTANPSLDSDNVLDNSSVNWPEEPS